MQEIFVLIGELPGDYGDFYERPTMPLVASSSQEALQEWWQKQPKPTPEDLPMSAYSEEGDDDPRQIQISNYTGVFLRSAVARIPYVTETKEDSTIKVAWQLEKPVNAAIVFGENRKECTLTTASKEEDGKIIGIVQCPKTSYLDNETGHPILSFRIETDAGMGVENYIFTHCEILTYATVGSEGFVFVAEAMHTLTITNEE